MWLLFIVRAKQVERKGSLGNHQVLGHHSSVTCLTLRETLLHNHKCCCMNAAAVSALHSTLTFTKAGQTMAVIYTLAHFKVIFTTNIQTMHHCGK